MLNSPIMYKWAEHVDVNRWDSRCNKFVKAQFTPIRQLISEADNPSESLNKIRHYELFELQISLRVIPEQITLSTFWVCVIKQVMKIENSCLTLLSFALASKEATFSSANWHWFNLVSVSMYQQWNLIFIIFFAHSFDAGGVNTQKTDKT